MPGKYKTYPEYKNSETPWLGDVPKDWSLIPLKYLSQFSGGGTPSKDNPEYWNGDIPWVSPKDMKTHRITSTIDNVTEKAVKQSSTNLLNKGALLVVVRSGILQHSIPVAINDVAVTLNQDMKAVRFNSKLNAKYAMYLIVGSQAALLLEWRKQGATVESIEQEYLANTIFPVPDLNEQDRIIKFLDCETSKIDTLIEKQQQFIQLLKEKREAVISNAITKGLNPHTKMRDSGVEWLGKVPAHWKTLSLGKITLTKCDGPFGSGLKSEHYSEYGVRVIRLQNIKREGYYEGEGAFIDEAYYKNNLSNHDVIGGDILIAGLGDPNNPVGRACVAPTDIAPAMVKADCFRFRLDGKKALPVFVARQLSFSAWSDAGRLSNGSTRARIPLSLMATRIIAICPLDEQAKIIEHIDALSDKHDKLEQQAIDASSLLAERRSALISAAVTGKIDVRDWVASKANQTNKEVAA